nr:hypothetical protein Iba_chr02cCG9680 [Ipomoea batatas]
MLGICFFSAATTSVQRLKVRGPLNDVTNVRPSKAQCTTKVDNKSVMCYNDLQKAIPFGATSSTPNVQTLSNLSTVRPSKAQCTTKVDKKSVMCCNDLQKPIPFGATSSTPNGQSLSNLSTVMGRTIHQRSQCMMANIADDFGRNLQAELETNFAIQRSQRLTFDTGPVVLDSQQLRIENIDTVKVDTVPQPAGKKNIINL